MGWGQGLWEEKNTVHSRGLSQNIAIGLETLQIWMIVVGGGQGGREEVGGGGGVGSGDSGGGGAGGKGEEVGGGGGGDGRAGLEVETLQAGLGQD